MERRLLNNVRHGNTESGVSSNGVTVVSGLSSQGYLQPAVYTVSPTEFQVLPDNRGDEHTLADVKMTRLPRHRFKDLGVLDQCTNLTILELAGNFITDVQPLIHCPRLLKLDLSRNQVRHLPGPKFWATLKRLRVLYLHDNSVGSLDEALALAAAPRLSVLTFMDTPLAVHLDYRPALTRALPRLLVLDSHVVTEQEARGEPPLSLAAAGSGRFFPLSAAQLVHAYMPCRQHTTWKQEARLVYGFLVEMHVLRNKHSPVHTLQRAWRRHRHTRQHELRARKQTWPGDFDIDAADAMDFLPGDPFDLESSDAEPLIAGAVIDNAKLLASLDRKISQSHADAHVPPLPPSLRLRTSSSGSFASESPSSTLPPDLAATGTGAGAGAGQPMPKWRVRLGLGLVGGGPLTAAAAAAPLLGSDKSVIGGGGIKRSELLSVSVSDLRDTRAAARGSLSSFSSASLTSLPVTTDEGSDGRTSVLGPLRQASVPGRGQTVNAPRRRNSWDGGKHGADALPGPVLPAPPASVRATVATTAAVEAERRRFGEYKQRLIEGRRGSLEVQFDAAVSGSAPPPARASSRPNSPANTFASSILRPISPAL